MNSDEKLRFLDRFYQALEDRGQDDPGDGRIRASLLSSFAQVEREIAQALKPAFDMGFGSVARVGACATVAVVTGERLYVANAGDCRAVLGQSGGSSEEGVVAVELTEVHNACIRLEKERLQASHPTEPIEKHLFAAIAQVQEKSAALGRVHRPRRRRQLLPFCHVHGS